MRIPISLRSDFDGSTARRIAKATNHAAQARRLLAQAEIYDGGKAARRRRDRLHNRTFSVRHLRL